MGVLLQTLGTEQEILFGILEIVPRNLKISVESRVRIAVLGSLLKFVPEIFCAEPVHDLICALWSNTQFLTLVTSCTSLPSLDTFAKGSWRVMFKIDGASKSVYLKILFFA